jgi:hypothetical protein
MNRVQIEHILRAAAQITGERLFVIVGSTSILAQYPNPPEELVLSREVDIYPKNRPDLTDEIDGAIGQGSHFEETHGYYADGVSPETAVLPYDWEVRAIQLTNENTGGAIGLAPEIHDLAVAKLYAGREKDVEWVKAVATHGLIDIEELSRRMEKLPDHAIEEKADLARRRAAELDYQSPEPG